MYDITTKLLLVYHKQGWETLFYTDGYNTVLWGGCNTCIETKF